MTMPTPETALIAAIHATIATWISGTNAFTGRMRPIITGVPVNAIFVSAYGGVQPLPVGGRSTTTREIAVQIMLRGAVDASATTLSQARALWAAVHKVAISGYTYCLCMQPDPIPAGTDGTGSPIYTINVTMKVED